MNGGKFDLSLLDGGDLLARLGDFFQDGSLEKLARQSRFVERSTSRLSGWMFLQLHLLMEASGQELSLTDMCEQLHERHGVELSKQSLDGRFNTFAVKFMRACFGHVFGQVVGANRPAPEHACFKRVLLTDATSYELPAHLACFYRGNGGDNSGSSVKIHQQYELLSGSVVELQIRDGKENDALFLEHMSYGQAGQELHLMDLGYFKLAHLEALDGAGGFFISRYKAGTNLYVKQGERFEKLDWQELLAGLQQPGHLPEVYMGEQKLKVRLVVEQVPEEVAAKRRARQRQKQARQSKSGKYRWQTSPEKELLLGYNLFVTNTTEKQLSAGQVQLYYRLRWQIELLFKVWKSVMEIDKVGRMSIFRFECYLYSRLIAILLSCQLHSMLKGYLEEQVEDFELSEWKVMKHLKKKSWCSARPSEEAAEQ